MVAETSEFYRILIRRMGNPTPDEAITLVQGAREALVEALQKAAGCRLDRNRLRALHAAGMDRATVRMCRNLQVQAFRKSWRYAAAKSLAADRRELRMDAHQGRWGLYARCLGHTIGIEVSMLACRVGEWLYRMGISVDLSWALALLKTDDLAPCAARVPA